MNVVTTIAILYGGNPTDDAQPRPRNNDCGVQLFIALNDRIAQVGTKPAERVERNVEMECPDLSRSDGNYGVPTEAIGARIDNMSRCGVRVRCLGIVMPGAGTDARERTEEPQGTHWTRTRSSGTRMHLLVCAMSGMGSRLNARVQLPAVGPICEL